MDGIGIILKDEGISGFSAGFVPILVKQVPYTMAAFVVQKNLADWVYNGMSLIELNPNMNLVLSLSSGAVVGVAAEKGEYDWCGGYKEYGEASDDDSE